MVYTIRIKGDAAHGKRSGGRKLDYVNSSAVIYDIQGYAVHDGPGIRTTVYTKGCPLHCLWCHSPESQRFQFDLGYLALKCLGTEFCQNACIKSCPEHAISQDALSQLTGKEEFVRKILVDRTKCSDCLNCTTACVTGSLYTAGWNTTVDEVYARVMKDAIFFEDGGGVTISGGECMSQFDFTFNLCKRLKASGIHICLDTTGFAPQEKYAEILPYVDLFLYDIKHMDSRRHKMLTGVPNEMILSNADFLANAGGNLQIRFPVIPKLNDSADNIRSTAAFCKTLGDAVKLVQLLPYHKAGRMKYERLGQKYKLSNVEPPEDAFMEKALAVFTALGLPAQIH